MTTRERIIRQAIEAITKNPNTGLDEIAEAAHVGRATLFRHFKSRAELITTLKLSAGEQIREVTRPILDADLPAREKLTKIVTELVPLGASLNVTAYFQHPFKDEAPELVACYHEHLAMAEELCQALKDEGAVRRELPLIWLVSSLNSLIFSAWEMVESGDIAPKQAPWLVLETYLAGHGQNDTRSWLRKRTKIQ